MSQAPTIGANGWRRHDADPLVGWARVQHGQGLCETMVPARRGVASHPCRSRATCEVWTTARVTLQVHHLCRTHVIPWVRYVARQQAGLDWRPGDPYPAGAVLHWRPLKGAAG